MDRANYERALKIFPEAFHSLGIDAAEAQEDKGGRIGIGYKHKATGIWMDVFPVDYSLWDVGREDAGKRLFAEWSNYRKAYLKSYKREDRVKLETYRAMDIPSWCTKEKAESVFYTAEFLYHFLAWKKDEIFPLASLKFENYSFPVPYDTDAYLTRQYGGNYMQFPRYGIAHHGDEGAGLADWAKRANIDMESVICELKEIYAQIIEEESSWQK